MIRRKLISVVLLLAVVLTVFPAGVPEAHAVAATGTTANVLNEVDGILGVIITPQMGSDEKVKAVYDFLIFQYVHKGQQPRPESKKITYTPKKLTWDDLEGIDTSSINHELSNAYSLIRNEQGVCDNFAALFAVMLNRMGIPCEIWGGMYLNSNGTEMPHAWNRASVDGKWYWYDVDVEGTDYRRRREVIYFLYKKDDAYWKTNHGSWKLKISSDSFKTIENITVRTAIPSPQRVTVDGAEISFDAYNIRGNHYFKLRDLANVLSGTNVQFEVVWDAAKNAIFLFSGQSYTPVGGEMTGKGSGSKTATRTTSKVYLNGNETCLTAYNIGGNNYFKLRDLAQEIDFGVDWDVTSNTVAINTWKGYTPES